MNQNHKPNPANVNSIANTKPSKKTRGAAIRAQRRTTDDAEKIVSKYSDSTINKSQKSNVITDKFNKLKITFLGGLEDVGEKNMAIIEYQNQALVLDCGIDLSIDLPGINYAINDTAYLDTIKHKIKAYVITHGHLDHIGGLKHTVHKYPAPIYGSRYTIGVIERNFEDILSSDANFKPALNIVNIDNHERLKIGEFFIEFIRVTHSIPDPTAICIDTPVGRIIATGDFRLDPEPLDNQTSDKTRLKQLGDEGVLLLMSDSSYADSEGRTPTEHTLQKSFHDIITNSPGRIMVASFSSNINRIQMIIDAAVASGRKVSLDGRSMLGYIEIAVRQGVLKVPKGSIIPMQETANIDENKLLVMCTGGQGEPNAALQRMSQGEHKYINLKQGDTVVISSSPIPGNEISYDQISNRLSSKGVFLFRHPTHELDGCGPLHVSGHARRDELREMLQLTRPEFFIPVHAGTLKRRYHAELGIEEGVARNKVLLPDNGDSFYFTKHSVEPGEKISDGSLLVDQTGSIVNGVVLKDRLMLSEEGILALVLTIDSKSGKLLSSPDIISRGFIAMRDSTELMKLFRSELARAVQQRFKRIDNDRFKIEIRDFATHFLFDNTGHSPIVIPVVNVINKKPKDTMPNNKAEVDKQRFKEMRENLLAKSK